MSTSLQFHHGPSKREVPARSVDISENGMLMYVPAITPVRAGQAVYVDLANIGGRPARGIGPVQATIVRVDRAEMTSKGYLGIGIRFAAA
ncbi:MAG: PilZ domain-containing protein [Phycisphaerae bacterium]|nr:PilZ domain-containing protein [Phycisphaerae bacterium]